jgi:ABC-type transporter Mla maintaining outer membrane lipid asymmetry permease subunit MlaE
MAASRVGSKLTCSVGVWQVTERVGMGVAETYDAEYVALTQLQAGTVATATIETLKTA